MLARAKPAQDLRYSKVIKWLTPPCQSHAIAAFVTYDSGHDCCALGGIMWMKHRIVTIVTTLALAGGVGHLMQHAEVIGDRIAYVLQAADASENAATSLGIRNVTPVMATISAPRPGAALKPLAAGMQLPDLPVRGIPTDQDVPIPPRDARAGLAFGGAGPAPIGPEARGQR
ncbi:hypothetical protein [Phaeovulum sp. NW3]|uniref:hypothetical protein n=1 Tax=Phaeovulum sp. NW3 TaxID=2934933 RepID=UPI002021AD4C|nr:hypothetical protein [Phaeovulum sp. NW3]MCL7465897.1 hypothetical protein [Phaeovulum sp. NW3]